MAVSFKDSETKDNLMRAFAGESQARNRYTFAASQAKEEKLQVISAIFAFTASQEKEHAEIFYNHLKELSGENITVDGAYPVDISDRVSDLLRKAQHNEYEEHDPVYKTFGEKAKEEGFNSVAASFFKIAEIEKIHGDRFGRFAALLEEGKLFVSDVEEEWMCLNCGYVYKGTEAPAVCPACYHDQGYFIRFTLAPYEGK
ncbi:MAG: rubrerythrin family protein [Candidatus Gastranaerophilales bacterium]|nr:rubrerythrin family protein [Candidatus Gastranaerophilales bacterium]